LLLGSSRAGEKKTVDVLKMCAIYQSLWVRKLIGKPAFLTIEDCESEARRIQFGYDKGIFTVAAESKSWNCLDLEIRKAGRPRFAPGFLSS
jgi:hypothetical protein